MRLEAVNGANLIFQVIDDTDRLGSYENEGSVSKKGFSSLV